MAKIQFVKIGKIKPHPNNPRVIEPEAMEKLVRSIKAFPAMLKYRPLIVQKSTGFVLGGNQRHKAAEILGMQELPVIYVDVDEKKAREIILKDNTQFGEWDFDKLKSFADKETLIEWGVEDAKYISFEDDQEPEEDEYEDADHDTQLIKKIVFSVPTEEYEVALDKLNRYIAKHGLNDNTDAIIKLLEDYGTKQ